MPEQQPIIILSLVDKQTERVLSDAIAAETQTAFQWIHGKKLLHRISQTHFLNQYASCNFHAVLVAADHHDLQAMFENPAGLERFQQTRERLPGCVIAVLPEQTGLEDAALAASIGFDGILAAPFVNQNIPAILQNAIRRRKQRIQIDQRYQRLRLLCRSANQKRRRLQQKVDLLCSDLVQSSHAMTETIHRYRHVYEFQNQLVGEFDINCMLHKALQMICSHIPDSSAVIYLNRHDDFAAHIVNPRFEHGYLLLEQENLLAETIIREVLTTRGSVAVDDASVWQPIAETNLDCLEGICLAGAPVIEDKELIAVLILYRSQKPFLPAEIRLTESFLPPLARSIQTAQTLLNALT